MVGDNIPIEALQGVNLPYIPKYYYSYPFTEDTFSHTDCICVSVGRFHRQLVGYNIKFLSVVNHETCKEILSNQAIDVMGFAFIKSTKKDSDKIIEDLKNNLNFYKP